MWSFRTLFVYFGALIFPLISNLFFLTVLFSSPLFSYFQIASFLLFFTLEIPIWLIIIQLARNSLIFNIFAIFIFLYYMLYGILNGLFILHHQKLFSHFEICFSFKEPLNAAIMVADELTTFYKICIFSSISLAIFIYSYSLKKTNFIFKKSHYFILIFSLAASLLLSFQKSSFLGQGAFIIRNYLKCYKLLESKAGLEKPDRIILKSTIKKDHQNRPNILLILNESLASQYLEGEEGRKVAPFHHNFFQKYSQELFRFKNAISNSGATDVSLPSLLTGLSPLSTRKSFHNNPLPWDYAKSLGYKTSLHSSHSLNWANFETFFINKNLDTKVYKETLNEPLVNDLGMDDNILVDSHLDYLESLDGSAPFFSILHLNVNHTPYFTQSKTNKFNNSTKKGRYLNSILLLDSIFEKLINKLETLGLLKNTIIFYLADHGEDVSYNKRYPRLYTLNLDILRSPFWLYLPKTVKTKIGPKVQQLEANTSRLISNLDFLPTFLDLLEFDLKELNKLGIKLSGSSLIRNLKIDRTIPCLNHGALRKWSTKPYAIGFKQKLFIFHDGYYPNQEFSLFDLNDPSDKNIWPKLNQTEKLKWHELVEKENLKK